MNKSNFESFYNQVNTINIIDENDFLEIVQYGGGLDECRLVGSKNALLVLALEIIKSCTQSKSRNKFSLSDIEFSHDSVVAFDSVAVKNLSKDSSAGFKLMGIVETIVMMSIVILIISLTIIGLYQVVSWWL